MILTRSPVTGRFWRYFVVAAIVAPLLAACGGGSVGSSGVKRAAFTSKEFGVAVSPRVTKAKYPPRGGGRALPPKPYVVRGVTYKPVEGPGYVARGQASWYGQDFHGRRTANGEIFGAYYLTAASPVLPVPSYARVTNLENGRSVLVRINDRGPFMQGRVIDMSYQAASILGYVNKGSAQVEVRYVAPAPLQGDDTKMLMASVDRLTDIERGATRFAMMETQRNESADPFAGNAGERVNFADYEAQRGSSRGSYSGKDFVNDVFGVFSYAEGARVSAAHAAANAMASRGTGLQDWVNVVDEDARAITLRLGVFRNDAAAVRVAEAFAFLGAVDEQQVELGGDPATVLTLVRLKPGVARADVLALAQELGLNDIVLY
jgi:rare lipoprotein A